MFFLFNKQLRSIKFIIFWKLFLYTAFYALLVRWWWSDWNNQAKYKIISQVNIYNSGSQSCLLPLFRKSFPFFYNCLLNFFTDWTWLCPRETLKFRPDWKSTSIEISDKEYRKGDIKKVSYYFFLETLTHLT